jgi:hypothetical protein
MDRDDYYVIMGAAMVLWGLRQATADIDLGCRHDVFMQVASRSSATALKQSRAGHSKLSLSQTTTLYSAWVPIRHEVIAGFRVAGLEDLLADKLRLGRPKDLSDVELIRKKLAGGG